MNKTTGLQTQNYQTMEFEADTQVVASIVSTLRNGETTVDELLANAYAALTEVTDKQLEESKGGDSYAVMELLQKLKEATDKTRPSNFQEEYSSGGILAVLGFFKKASRETRLNIKAFLEEYETYRAGFDAIEKSLHERVEALGNDLNEQEKTIKAILQSGHNLMSLKIAMEEIHDSGDLGKMVTMEQKEIAKSNLSLLQKQIVDIEGITAYLQTSLYDEIQELINTQNAKNDLVSFVGQAIPLFKKNATKAIRNQRTQDAVKIKNEMRGILNDFITEQAGETAQASLGVTRANQQVLIEPEVFEQYRIRFSQQIEERMKIQEEGARHQQSASASYRKSLDEIQEVLAGNARIDEKGNLIPKNGKVAQLEEKRATESPSAGFQIG